METFVFFATSLFTMINPVGAIPLFISLTDSFSAKQCRSVAIKAALASFVSLALFALAGKIVFDFFGISIDGLRLVGGILFFLMGYEMLRGRTIPKRLENEDEKTFGDDIAITPLAIPMIAGPGAITMVILFFQEAENTGLKLLALSSILSVCLITGLILIAGRKILSLLGPSGSRVMMRIMGLIVMLIAVEFFFKGATPYVREMLRIN